MITAASAYADAAVFTVTPRRRQPPVFCRRRSAAAEMPSQRACQAADYATPIRRRQTAELS